MHRAHAGVVFTLSGGQWPKVEETPRAMLYLMSVCNAIYHLSFQDALFPIAQFGQRSHYAHDDPTGGLREAAARAREGAPFPHDLLLSVRRHFVTYVVMWEFIPR